MTIVISIEGNIGVGKSTLLKRLSELGLSVLLEPVPDESLMSRYYSNPKLYALEVQLNFLNRRRSLLTDFLEKNVYKNLVFIDRSILGDLAFAKTMHKTNILSDEDYAAYLRVNDSYAKAYPKLIPDHVIVLEAPSFQEQLNRINKRNSKYETDNLDESFINYLKSLDESNKEVFPKEKCAYITNYSNQIEKIVDQTIVFALAAMFKDEPNVLPLESFYKAWFYNLAAL